MAAEDQAVRLWKAWGAGPEGWQAEAGAKCEVAAVRAAFYMHAVTSEAVDNLATARRVCQLVPRGAGRLT